MYRQRKTNSVHVTPTRRKKFNNKIDYIYILFLYNTAYRGARVMRTRRIKYYYYLLLNTETSTGKNLNHAKRW